METISPVGLICRQAGSAPEREHQTCATQRVSEARRPRLGWEGARVRGVALLRGFRVISSLKE